MPKKDEGLRRVALNCLVARVTREAIGETQKETGESQGEVVDRAVALLAYGEEVGVTGRGLADLVETQNQASEMDDIVMKHVARTSTVPEWKRGPRQKGDKSR